MSTRVTLAIVNGSLRFMLTLMMGICIANKFAVEYRSDQADNRFLYIILCMGFLAVIYAIDAASLPKDGEIPNRWSWLAAKPVPAVAAPSAAAVPKPKPVPPPMPTGPLTRPIGRVPDDRINIDEWDIPVVKGTKK